MSSEISNIEETIEHKIFSFCFSMQNDTATRGEFTDEVKDRLGIKAKKVASDLWNKGCFKINQYGYVNLSKRGYTYWKTGILHPKRKPKPKLTTADYLNYFWKNNQKEFEDWLRFRGL